MEENSPSARFSPVRQADARHRAGNGGRGAEAAHWCALCIVERQTEQGIIPVESEVAGFNGQTLFLMPLEHVDGILRGRAPRKATATPVNNCPWAASAGPRAGCAGSTVDGRPAPGKPAAGFTPTLNPLHRDPIKNVLDVGVRAINGLLTVGRGQRMACSPVPASAKACCSA